MSALGIAGNIAGLLSLTVQLIGSIKPVVGLVDSLKRSSTTKKDNIDQVKGFHLMLQSSLDRWRQEPPVDTGATIQILEECHQEILRIQDIVDHPRDRLQEYLRNHKNVNRISSAITRCREGLQLNLALEHSFTSYRNGKVLTQEVSAARQRIDQIHTDQTQNTATTSQSMTTLNDKLDSIQNRNMEDFTEVKSSVARAEAELQRHSRTFINANIANDNNYQAFTQGVTSIHHQLGDAKSEITAQISALERLVTRIDHRMESRFQAQEARSRMNEQPANIEAAVTRSLQQFMNLSTSQLWQQPSNHPEPLDIPLSGRKRPLWKRITVSQRFKRFETRLFQVYIRSRVIRLHTNKTLGDFDLDDRYETETSFRIHPSLWFFKTAFSVSCVQSNYSRLTNLQFQVYNTRPDGALIFEFCSSGNVDGVKSLITRKDASPFDIDSDGWTPLHYAAQAQDLATCKLLIHVGASGTALDYSQTSVLHRVFENIHFNQSVHSKEESGRFPDTLRLLVEYAKADPWAEDSDGITCIDLAIQKRPLYNAVEEWLMQYQPLEFDPEHRDGSGRTLLHQIYRRFEFPHASRDIDVLLALGANINAQILSGDKSSGHGFTVLHLAARKCAITAVPLMKAALQECQYFIKKGIDPHVLNCWGHTATDIILENIKTQEEDCRLVFWRDMLIDLDIDLKQFLRNEILAHKDTLWFTTYGCDEFLLAIFGFAPRYDRLSQEFEYLSHLELQTTPFDANLGHLDFLPPAAESDLLSQWDSPDNELIVESDSESGFLDNLLDDWFPAPENEYEPESEYGSAQEDIPEASVAQPAFTQMKADDFRKLFSVGQKGLARFSKYQFEESAWEDWNEWKEYHWAPYREALETNSLESLDPSQRARWEQYKLHAIGRKSGFGQEGTVPWYSRKHASLNEKWDKTSLKSD